MTAGTLRRPTARGLLATCVALTLVGCATRPPAPDAGPTTGREVVVREGPAPRHERDRAPDPRSVPTDIDRVPDAVPRAEPRSRYGNPESYEVFGRRYHVLASAEGYRERGIASWYGEKFHGRRTSSREPYDMYAMTAAHKTLPLPTYVRVTHLENGRSVIVRVNDRGPFVDSRIIDLSYAAAARLGMVEDGHAPVEVVALQPEMDDRDSVLVIGEAGDIVDAVALREELRGLGVENLYIQQRADQRYEVHLGPVTDSHTRQELRDWLEARAYAVRGLQY